MDKLEHGWVVEKWDLSPCGPYRIIGRTRNGWINFEGHKSVMRRFAFTAEQAAWEAAILNNGSLLHQLYRQTKAVERSMERARRERDRLSLDPGEKTGCQSG